MRVKKLFCIFLFTLIASSFFLVPQTTLAATDPFVEMKNLKVPDGATNADVLEVDQSKLVSPTKYFNVGLYRNLPDSMFSADLWVYERDDKQYYIVVEDNGHIAGYYQPAKRTLNWQNDLTTTFQAVQNFNNFGMGIKPTYPANYYIIEGKVTGLGTMQQDFVDKCNDFSVPWPWEGTTDGRASVTFRVGAGGPILSQGYMRDDGSFVMINNPYSGVVQWQEPNSVIMNTDHSRTTVLAYAWYKDPATGDIWEGSTPVDLTKDFTVAPDIGITSNTLKNPLNLVMKKTTTPALVEAPDNTINGGSAIDAAMSGAIKTLADVVQTAMHWTMGQIDKLLLNTADYVVGKVDCKGNACGVLGPWTAMRNIGLTLLVMALIVIAFANVLQIDIEQYGLNRMIPKIIISIILAFFSWVIVIFFFDFTQAIQSQAMGLLGGTQGLGVLGDLTLNTPSTGDIAGKAGAIILLLVILVAVFVCGAVLVFTLLMRIVMLSFLLAVAPLAFILNIVPFTSSLYKQWWTEFWKWMFMGPVALIIISLGSVIAASVSGGQFGAGKTLGADFVNDSGTGGEIVIGLLIFGASMYVAATLPMQWGGKIMQGWGKFGKNAWGKTGGKMLGSAKTGLWNQTGGRITQPVAKAWKGYRNESDRKRNMKTDMAGNSLLKAASFGKYGTDRDVMQRKLQDAEIAAAGESIGVGTAGQPKLIERYKTAKNPNEKAAIRRQMAKEGDLEKLYTNDGYINKDTGGWAEGGLPGGPTKEDIQNEQRRARQSAGMDLANAGGQDQTLEGLVKDNEAELYVAGYEGFKASGQLNTDGSATGSTTTAATYAKSKFGATLAGQKNKTLREKRSNILDDIAPEDVDKFMTEFDKDNIGNAQVSSAKVKEKFEKYKEREKPVLQARQAAAYNDERTGPATQARVQAEAHRENTVMDAQTEAEAEYSARAKAASAPAPRDTRVENPEMAQRLAEQENNRRNGLQ